MWMQGCSYEKREKKKKKKDKISVVGSWVETLSTELH